MNSVITTGILQGFLYSLMSSGFVLVYRVSGVLNFAHGAVATMGAYITFQVVSSGGNYWVGASVAIAVGAIISAAIEVVVVRRLERAHHTSIAIATLGVALTLAGICLAIWGATPVPLVPPISTATLFVMGGVNITSLDLVTIAIVGSVFAGLGVLIQYSSFGLAMRAVNEGPATSALLGINVRRTRLIVWGLSGVVAVVSGLLIAPTTSLDPNGLTTFFIASFTVVVLGGLESIKGIFVGGIAFGMLNSFFAYLVTPRLLSTFSLVAILVVLVFFPHGLFGKATKKVNEPEITSASVPRQRSIRGLVERFVPVALLGRRSPAISRALFMSMIAAIMLAPVLLPGAGLLAMTLAASTFLAVVGQQVLFGQAGLISIGQSGFMVVGAYGVATLGIHLGVPGVVAIFGAVVFAVLVSCCLALIAARLTGVYMALVTMGFALALPELVAFDSRLAGGATGTVMSSIGPIGLTADPRLVYYLILLIGLLTYAMIAGLSRTSHGRAWRAVRDSEAGSSSLGISLRRIKIEATAIAAGLAALSGILSALLVGYLAPTSFTLWTSIYILAALVIGGSGSIRGAILGTFLVFGLPSLMSAYANAFQIAFGIVLVVVLFLLPRGFGQIFDFRKPSVSAPQGRVSVADVPRMPSRRRDRSST